MKRRGVWVLGILALVLVTAYFGSSRRSPGPPLDPTSTSPDGAKAVVELVGRNVECVIVEVSAAANRGLAQ